MYRTHNCGELRKSDIGKQVSLSGWVQKMRDKGFMIWVDIRDRVYDLGRYTRQIRNLSINL